MLTRSLLTSVLPTERRRWRPRLLVGLRTLGRRLAEADRRARGMQARADTARARCMERHYYGMSRTWR
jgi:hypothetical protein